MTHARGWILALVALAGSTAAQGTTRPYDPPPESYRSPQQGVDLSQPTQVRDPEEQRHEVEIALNDEAFWLGYRTPLRRGEGHLLFEFFADDDDDYMLTARLMRFGAPSPDSALSFGVGIGAHIAWLDRSDDENIYAVSLSGNARYGFPTDLPTYLGLDLTFAPDVTTFDDGEQLLDVSVRAEAEISSFATAFVGYRYLQVDLTDGSDHELDEQVHVGVRLGF